MSIVIYNSDKGKENVVLSSEVEITRIRYKDGEMTKISLLGDESGLDLCWHANGKVTVSINGKVKVIYNFATGLHKGEE